MSAFGYAPTIEATQTWNREPGGSLRDRLVPPMPPPSVWGWLGPLLVTVFGGFLRFSRLGVPRAVVFDETYYVPDAYGILKHGVEISAIDSSKNRNVVDHLLAHGGTHILGNTGEYVVHPPLGKIMIAIGEWLFGLTPFGWRFATAAVGTLSILLIARITRRMTRSTLLGCVAGLLLSLDGLELVLSRTAILDIFVMFWVLAAFGMLVLDRDHMRGKIADAALAGGSGGSPPRAGMTGGSGGSPPRAGMTGGSGGSPPRAGTAATTGVPGADLPGGGPNLGIRWRRVLAGVFLGCAVASKWNGIWFLLAFAVMAIAWDLGARRAAGYRDRLIGVLRSDVTWLPVTFVAIPFVTYATAWSGWFTSNLGYDKNWAAVNGNHVPVWSTLDSWYQYQHSMLGFGLGLSSQQGYVSKPWSWLVLGRPVSFYFTEPRGCGGKCWQEVLAIGTPAIWWASIPALLFCLGWWISRRDWRAGATLVGVAAGWLPWFWFTLHDNRTEYYFYAIAFLPFLVIAITLCIGLIIGPVTAPAGRRAIGAVIAGAYLLLVLANFAYMYPVLAAQALPEPFWHQRMWFSSWI